MNANQILLEIIKVCEDYQNADTESMELEEQCDDGYRVICKVIGIASGALAELEARANTGNVFRDAMANNKGIHTNS